MKNRGYTISIIAYLMIQAFLSFILFNYTSSIFSIGLNILSIIVNFLMVILIYANAKENYTLFCLLNIIDNLVLWILIGYKGNFFLFICLIYITLSLVILLFTKNISKKKANNSDDSKVRKLLSAYQKATEKTCYQAVKIDGIPGILDDKIGGIPYLPLGEAYPVDRHGQPMALLFQADLSAIDLPDFYNQGILEIFVANNEDYPTEYQIKHFEKGLAYQMDLKESDHSESFYRHAIKITFRKSICQMPIANYRSESTLCSLANDIYHIDAKRQKNLNDFFALSGNEDWLDCFVESLVNPTVCIGGYGDFTQSDPRAEGNDKSESLLKIDNLFDTKNLTIGDCGIINVVISKEDLRSGNFAGAVLDWDCY